MVRENCGGVSTSSAASLTRMPVVWMRAPGSPLASMTTVRRPRSAAVRAQIEAGETRADDDEINRPVRLPSRPALQRRHPERRHLVLALFQDFEAEAVEGEGLADFGNHPRLVDDQPGEVVASSSGRSQSKARLRSRIGTAPSTMKEPSGLPAHAGRHRIMLVDDVADDLLDDVFERDEALHLAIFVDDEGEMRLAPEEGVELVGDGAGVGHVPGRA